MVPARAAELKLPDMVAALRELLAQVPAGRVTTCGKLAEALGDRVAALWVARWLSGHEHPAECPCHRVVRATGRLGAYVGGDEAAKARRLAAEGVEAAGGLVDLERFVFERLRGPRPLALLRQWQEDVARRVRLAARCRVPARVGGVDVSYAAGDVAVAAYVLVEVESGAVVYRHTLRSPATFPYISSFLAFRELPVLLALIEAVRAAGQLAGVVLVDGSGVLHPRRSGIACHLGVAASLPTVGVTKKLLVGETALTGMEPLEGRPIMMKGRRVGTALRPTAGSRRPIFVSPGHRVDAAFAEMLVRRLLRGRRLPEPLYWADRLSREEARRVVRR